MATELISRLGIRQVFETGSGIDIDTVESQLGVKLSKTHSELLCKFGGALVFDNGAKYKTRRQSPVDAEDGYQSIEMLYGLEGDYDLITMNEMYGTQIPRTMYVIGESVGGNQICVSRENGCVYFWFHEAKPHEESLFKIADCMDVFLDSLESDSEKNERETNRNVVESESYLDF